MSEKIQKILANAGLASRREIEKWIAAGRISVNGSIATLGDRATEKDTIRVDGNPVMLKAKDETYTRVIAYHKPLNEVSTAKDPQGRATVFDSLPRTKFGRWIGVGRLDINTTGLLLFTNNGELAHKLMHPSYSVERRYAVRVFGEVTNDMLNNLKKGVLVDGDLCQFDKIIDKGGEGANHWYEVSLSEGKNREVRKLWQSQGVEVSRLIRVKYGPVELPTNLSRGRWIDLDAKAIDELAKVVELKVTARKEKPDQKRKEKGKFAWSKKKSSKPSR
ncbi:23S rRNA pseudouridine(2605) synthase RluB [Kangiella sp. HZ709]|uniref:23S rRNA pseudouridine(2605) synthase RluB n=1 Tax=Kangiella sp. HZ709 TaxID=2666328 RepID=UPI0012B083F8|nr:pseudouridine synthase [Kangiella sp. HZ709]MRX28360.1 pseudouridine synthase [Kangiella sp. HZ709]